MHPPRSCRMGVRRENAPQVCRDRPLAGELRAFSSILTPSSLLREATLEVIAEWEQQVCSAEQLHCARIRHWD